MDPYQHPYAHHYPQAYGYPYAPAPPARPRRNWWRWSTLAFAVLATWQGMGACSAREQAKQHEEQTAFYRGRWSQVCYLLAHCSESDCESGCGTDAWCR